MDGNTGVHRPPGPGGPEGGVMPDEQNELVTQLTKALKESRSGTDKQLEEVNKTLSQLSPKIEQLQRDVLNLQSEMKTQFVPRTEYEPRHQMITDAIHRFDQMVLASEPNREKFIRMQTDIEGLKKENIQLNLDIQDVDKRLRGIGRIILPWIGTAVSIIALILTFLSHVNFK